MEALTLAVMGVVNILCFCLGAKVGQAVSKGEKVEVPSVNPMKAIREHQEHQERKEAKKVQNRIDAIMRNIDNYDGTGYGQEDVPEG